MRLPLGRISATHSFIRVWRCRPRTHAEDVIQIAGHGHTHNLDGHPTPLVYTLRHNGKAPMGNFHSAFRAVGDAHRLWDHSMSTARFAKLIEQFQSFRVRQGVIPETLWPTLALGLEEEKAEEPALSISPIRLSISGSESRRNWKREAIRGRNLTRCCSPVSIPGMVQLS